MNFLRRSCHGKLSTYLISLILKLHADITKWPNKIHHRAVKLQQSTVCSSYRVVPLLLGFKNHERFSPPIIYNWIRRPLFVQILSSEAFPDPFFLFFSFQSFLLSFSLPSFLFSMSLQKRNYKKHICRSKWHVTDSFKYKEMSLFVMF